MDNSNHKDQMTGWLRKDGRKGIRNILTIVYLVECAHHVAHQIARPFDETEVQVIGFSGCFPSNYANNLMEQLCTHPNVGAVLLVSLGCENFQKKALIEAVERSGRPVHLVGIQAIGGTKPAITEGRHWVSRQIEALADLPKVSMRPSELVIGTICGGSDGTSGITGNPATGRAFDRLLEQGATCIFEETGELIGCEHIMADRMRDPSQKDQMIATVQKAARYYDAMGYGSFSQGNADGGLSTIEEKSLGAYAKSGSSLIDGIIKPGEQPRSSGLYLMDVVPDDDPKYGYPNINDNAEIIELIACGAHAVVFVTGRGSVVGSAISPVLKVCANPDTYSRMSDDMDVNAGRILNHEASLDDVGDEICTNLYGLANGQQTASEAMGHCEFVLTYKSETSIPNNCVA